MRFFRSLAAPKLALVVLFAAAPACTDFSRTPESLGRVIVTVTDQANQGVFGQEVQLLMQDRIQIWRRLITSQDGTGEFGREDGGVISQHYVVRIIPTGEYNLAQGETNDKAVQVVIGQTHTVTFKLARRVVGMP